MTAAAAIAWELRRRHRWGFRAITAYLIVIAAIKVVILARGTTVRFESGEGFAAAVMAPLTTTFTYFLALFSYGLSGDLGARQSIYPARMFTLPVSTAALAGWPMLYGSLAVALLWAATRLLAVWPSGFDIPVFWPAVLAATLLCWTQALTWMPYGLPGLRVILAVLCLGAIDTVVLLALQFQAREWVILAITAPQIPLSYLVARRAVARARSGVVPDWRGAFAWIGRRARVVRVAHDDFASRRRAQLWFEWRQHGRALPALVAILLPFELLLLLAARNAPMLVVEILFGVLVTPPFMAAFVAATLRKSDPAVRDTRDAYGLTPFVATRPVSSPELVAAKLEMTIWSTLATWTLVLAAIPSALVLTDTWQTLVDRFQRTVEVMGAARAIAFVALVVAGFMASTWKQLVQSLYIGLSGRDWVVRTSVAATLVFLCVLGPVLDFIIENRGARIAVWNAVPWLLGVLAVAKICVAVWVAMRLFASRLLADRTLVIGAAAWCTAVLLLYGVLSWWVDTELVAHSLLAFIAILAVPLARISAAPLALAWNRHR